MENIVKNLIDSGLEEEEANIYLAILLLGKATISDIARKAGIKRTTIYSYIGELLRKDLIHKTAKGRRIYYIAEHPEKIIRRLEAKKKKIEAVLPQLTKFYCSASFRPNLRYYEGIEGMREIYREMTKTSKILYSVFSADEYNNVFTEEDGWEFLNNIREHGGKLKYLVEDTEEGRRYLKGGYHKGIGSGKLLPKGFSLSHSEVQVTGNKVTMLSLVNLVGVIIENPEIAEVQKNFIEFIWKNTK